MILFAKTISPARLAFAHVLQRSKSPIMDLLRITTDSHARQGVDDLPGRIQADIGMISNAGPTIHIDRHGTLVRY
ncbi:hypothetical protein [Limimaricola pyoseonensis]|uniref:Uncharacterized protein n=1 Tax=Limimaricola pyoseonensis TaxID=521013 RepID=A0A1G7IGM1_9RHOB|nr:hypothetical protein [Limimaricola pyoseonensis]SDF11900.1 hypothetical protein SAMN04488567_3462 [Limimaricola pyoseonensis]